MTNRVVAGAGLALLTLVVWASPLLAGPVTVRFPEGVARGFPVLRSLTGERLARGEMIQFARGDRIESRLVFRFDDGSVYDETVVFSQREVFTLETYRLVQKGPSFPERIEASIERATSQYAVRYRADDESPEEQESGRFTLPADVYSGMLGILMKNLPPGASETVQILVFTPRPRLIKVQLAPAAEDQLTLGEQRIAATRFLIKPQLGLLASLLVVDLAPLQCWVVGGEAPAFVKFQGPLYFMGPIWRIELN